MSFRYTFDEFVEVTKEAAFESDYRVISKNSGVVVGEITNRLMYEGNLVVSCSRTYEHPAGEPEKAVLREGLIIEGVGDRYSNVSDRYDPEEHAYDNELVDEARNHHSIYDFDLSILVA